MFKATLVRVSGILIICGVLATVGSGASGDKWRWFIAS